MPCFSFNCKNTIFYHLTIYLSCPFVIFTQCAIFYLLNCNSLMNILLYSTFRQMFSKFNFIKSSRVKCMTEPGFHSSRESVLPCTTKANSETNEVKFSLFLCIPFLPADCCHHCHLCLCRQTTCSY